MKLIITGAAGFIGTELSIAACGEGHTVYGCDVAPSPSDRTKSLENYEYICVSGIDPSDVIPGGADCMVILAAKRPYDGFCFDDYLLPVEL
ncbi:MAG: NAD(P)-dependent oxidoreductase [Clostridia bacterium]|nr:NAD(P)-dependent oxidoreductase [Clostridia bacterium]